MRLPGFAAESALYRTSVHYKMAVGAENAVLPPQAFEATFGSSMPLVECGGACDCLPGCALDGNNNCTRECKCPRGCVFGSPTRDCNIISCPCSPGACCPPGREGCGVSPGGAGFCCPTGEFCCNPATRQCCAANQTCTAGGVCCPNANVCGDQCCAAGQNCLNGCCATNTGALKLNSNTNYLLANCANGPNCAGSCQNIEDLIVRFNVGPKPMVAAVTPCSGGSSTPNGGFTIQLNAYNPAGDGLQYIFLISGNQIAWQVQYWQGGTQFYSNPAGSGSTTIVSLPSANNTIPGGYIFEIALNNVNGNVTGGRFQVTDNNGKTTSSPFGVNPTFYFPIRAFQVNIIGPDGCQCSEFSPGGGTLTYEVSSGQLCVEGGLPEVCSGTTENTCETSNASYGPIGPNCCSSTLSQSVTFSTALKCPNPPGCCSSTCAG